MSTTQTSAAAKPAPHSDVVQTRPLSRNIGAEIIGVDLSKPIGDGVFQTIRDIWHQNLVILLRDQHLTEDDQVRFGEKFGPPAVSHTKRFTTKNPAVMLISNIRENGKLIGALPDGEMNFHTDQCHQERPAMASMLYALEIPREGGNTLFANAYKAYETLPDALKARIEGRKALNAYDYDNAATHRGTKVREGIPSYWHPIVRTHPATGRKALYVNRLMTVAIEGMPEAESNEVLNALFDHQEQREFIYEHVWRPYDVLLWDNRCTLHARTDFSDKERRLLRRHVVQGERVY
jgi:taurine dioxygenase